MDKPLVVLYAVLIITLIGFGYFLGVAVETEKNARISCGHLINESNCNYEICIIKYDDQQYNIDKAVKCKLMQSLNGE